MNIEPIGYIRCGFSQKFAIPRQSQLGREIKARIEISMERCPPECFSELAGFNFIWLISLFHEAGHSQSKVRPPRLGGNKRVGVFATRSPFRPNPIALSLVKLEEIEFNTELKKNILHIKGLDLLDQTPVLDIKPFVHAHDTPWEQVTSGWDVDQEITRLSIHWEDKARLKIQDESVMASIEAILSLDPRPAFHQEKIKKDYHFKIDNWDIHFYVQNAQVIIFDVTKLIP